MDEDLQKLYKEFSDNVDKVLEEFVGKVKTNRKQIDERQIQQIREHLKQIPYISNKGSTGGQ